MWSLKVGDKFYVALANALENNVSLYYTEKGRRNALKYVDAPVPANTWHTLRVEFSGTRIRVALNGKRTPDGQVLRTNDDVRRYLLKAAGFAVVPFQAFGVKEDTGWFRLSVGAVSMTDIERVLPVLRQAIQQVT